MEAVGTGTVSDIAQLRSIGGRRCARPGCAASAHATLTFSYQERAAWLRPLAPTRLPQAYDLCPLHAGRTRPPRGWRLSDERAGGPQRAVVGAAARDVHPAAATGRGQPTAVGARAVTTPPGGFDHDRAVSVLARVLGADRFPPPADLPLHRDAEPRSGAPVAPAAPGPDAAPPTQLPLSLPTARPDLRPDPRAPVPDRPGGPARSW